MTIRIHPTIDEKTATMAKWVAAKHQMALGTLVENAIVEYCKQLESSLRTEVESDNKETKGAGK